MPVHEWEEIVKRIEQATDLAQVTALLKELNDAMIAEEREKV